MRLLSISQAAPRRHGLPLVNRGPLDCTRLLLPKVCLHIHQAGVLQIQPGQHLAVHRLEQRKKATAATLWIVWMDGWGEAT